jgi:hypothetical protein
MLTKRQEYELLRSQLENERSSFLPHWRDLGDFILPRRPRMNLSDMNRGERRNTKIIDSSATLATRTLRSGMMSGITSPARPWFRLGTPDPALSEYGPVRGWLDIVGQRMSTAFLKSNLYNALPIIYGDLGVFGTSALLVEEDFSGDLFRFYALPIGSYSIANDENLRVRTFIREFNMTVRQLVAKFGRAEDGSGEIDWSKFSTQVKNAWDQRQYEMWVPVVHVITQNIDFDPNKLHSKFKRYSSCYYESGAANVNQISETPDVFLRESGYDYFPVLAPRWEVTGEDCYGTDCPGMTALGDIKQLQLGEKRAAQAIEKMVHPPMVAPTSLMARAATILPGGITYVDERDGQKGFRPAHEVNPRIAELSEWQQQVRERISRSFFEDLFLMLSQSDRREITAREIDERHEEKLLALGPVLEQLNQDLLDPLIDIAFDIMLRQGRIPEPPEELKGMPLKVEYISIMAQAQKLVGLAGIERFAGFVNQIAQTDPTILDKVDQDQMVDVYGDLTSVPAGIVRSDEDVAKIRAQRAQAQQAQHAAEVANQSAQAAKHLSQTDTGGDNALTRLLQNAQAGQLVEAN